MHNKFVWVKTIFRSFGYLEKLLSFNLSMQKNNTKRVLRIYFVTAKFKLT